MIRDIAGRQNHTVKLVRKLQKKKHRRERGLLVCEGMDLLVAAVEAGAPIRDVLVRGELMQELPPALVRAAESEDRPGHQVDIGVCDQKTLDYAGSLGGAADVLFTCTQPEWNLSDLDVVHKTVFFLDGVGDPGNVGTLARGALAFGLGGMACAPGTADPYGPKAMRAGMGAQFSLPVVIEVTPQDMLAKMAVMAGREGTTPDVWVADPHEGVDVRDGGESCGALIVLGAEREGARSSWEGGRRLRIPQERFDSLNVAMAGTVLAYEFWRKQGSPGVANGGGVR